METKVRVAALSELPDDGGKAFEIAGRTIAFFKVGESVYAMDNACPHRGAALAEGICRNGKVFCNWHLFDFDLVTGHCEVQPDMPVRTYPASVEGGDIFVGIQEK